MSYSNSAEEGVCGRGGGLVIVIGLDRHRHNSITIRRSSRTLALYSISLSCKTYTYMSITIYIHNNNNIYVAHIVNNDASKPRGHGKGGETTKERLTSGRLRKGILCLGTMHVGSGLCYYLRHVGLMYRVLGTRPLTYVPKTGIFRKVVLMSASGRLAVMLLLCSSYRRRRFFCSGSNASNVINPS
jgi:hypothetical protein